MIDHDQAGARAAADSFVGRERELAGLRQLTAAARVIALCGPAGIGKTRLLQQLVADVAADFAGGAFVVSLGDLRQPDLIAPRVAAAIGIAEEPGIPPAAPLAEPLRGRRLLLALDHCDQLSGACADLGARLLAAAPGLLLITTCREPQGPPETLWPVPAPPGPARPPPLTGSLCSPSGPPRPPPASPWTSAAARPWPRSAGRWPACRWPSSWPPPGPESCRPASPRAARG